MIVNIIEKSTDLLSRHISFVQVTMIGVKGSAPQELGAKLLVTESGEIFGTIGGGKLEAYCIEKSKVRLIEGGEELFIETLNLQKDIKMTCGGEVTLLFEPFLCAKWKIAVFGAGHVAQSLVPLLLSLGAFVYCIDSRGEWLNKFTSDSNLKAVLLDRPAHFVDELSDDTFVLSVTMGHAHDVPILNEALKRDFPYLAVIGSHAKRKVLVKELADKNHSIGVLDKLICPAGLNIGGNRPAEIAISIAAQMLQYKSNKR